MKKNFYYLVAETKQLINYKGRIFIINTVILGIIFLLMNFFVISKYNINNVEAYFSRNIQIKLLLKDFVKEDKIIEFEKELIGKNNIDYHSYNARELAIKTLENRMNLSISQRNPLKNSFIIYTKDIKNIKEVEALASYLENVDIVEKVLFNRELITKLIKAKETMAKLKTKMNIFFVLPLFIFIYLIFKLNFINYEDELSEKYKREGKGILVFSPYFLKKLLNIVLAWTISLVFFSNFYQSSEKLLYDMSPNINIVVYESLPKSIFINPLIISVVILIIATMFVRIRGDK